MRKTFNLGLLAVGMFAAGHLGAGPLRAQETGAVVELDGLSSRAPAGWKQEQPKSQMRLTQFKLPKAEGDPADAELVVFYFRGGSGTVEQNLKRQEAKFEPADGKKLDVKVEKIKVGPHEATYQDIKGTYLEKFPPFAPNAKITRRENYRQLYVVFTGKKGEYYLTLLGPAKTVEKHKGEFENWLKNFK
ncbi:MAG TPA: hypothetical protein VIL46_11755 [Gemmataceae bacterium]